MQLNGWRRLNGEERFRERERESKIERMSEEKNWNCYFNSFSTAARLIERKHLLFRYFLNFFSTMPKVSYSISFDFFLTPFALLRGPFTRNTSVAFYSKLFSPIMNFKENI